MRFAYQVTKGQSVLMAPELETVVKLHGHRIKERLLYMQQKSKQRDVEKIETHD